MFNNYIKVAWRSLNKNKVYAALNIFGLAIGLCCFILIMLYVVDELSYDRFHENSSRIYRINSDIKFGGAESLLPFTSDVMGPAMKEDYHQVEEFVRLYNSNGSKLIRKGNDFVNENNIAHADSTFFQVFSLPLLAGDPNSALNQPNTVVVSELAAEKYFGTHDVLGKVVETIDGENYQITAVMKNIPNHSHFRFNFIFSMENVDYDWGSNLSHNFHTYLLLKAGADPQDFEEYLRQYIIRHVMPLAQQVMNINSIEEFEASGNALTYSLMPINRIHLFSDRQFELSPGGNIQYVYIFSAVAIFILLIACVNFMNLTTARFAEQAKEVGIRKVLGSGRNQLIQKFLTESTIMVFLALIIALGVAYFVLPAFNNISVKMLSLSSVLNPSIILILLIIPFLVGLLAGSYPAVFLSSFQPVQVLKGKLMPGAKSSTFRSVLVIFQFTISIILIIGTIIVNNQLQFIQNKNVGFNKDQVLIVNDTYTLGKNATAFKDEVTQFSGVEGGTYSGYLPVNNSSRNELTYSKDAAIDSKSGFNMQTWTIDDNYLNIMGMELVNGRNFYGNSAADSSSIIINETTAKFLGYEDPIGKMIYTIDDFQKGGLRSLEIIGVVKNFHYESLRQSIGPLGFVLGKSIGLASFKVNAAEIPLVLAGIKEKWTAMTPGMPFSYRFLDESFEEMYRAEQRIGQISLIFSLLAIIVASLGLFGLSTFIAEKRIKEIGIRKILGASVFNLVHLISQDFLKLVFIAFVIATPIAWYAMHNWLEDFAYRVDINWWVFPGSGLLAMIIALATVSIQAVKAAISNPIKNLKTE